MAVHSSNLELAEILEQRADWRFKGFPADGTSVGEVAARGWHAVRDLVTPLLVVRESAVRNNIAVMADYCRRHGVSLAPHVKTPVSPQLAAWQLEAGAWGISVANFHQARVFRHFGVSRIFIANQVLEPMALAWLGRELADDVGFEAFCLVDSVAGVELMETTLRRGGASRPLSVLIELGPLGGRAGCRDADAVRAVVSALRRSPHLRLAGLEAYEGAVPGDPVRERMLAIDAFLDWFRETAGRLVAERAFADTAEVILSAGGSLFFDRVVEALRDASIGTPTRVLLRCGSYLMQDAGDYQRLSPLADRGGSGDGLRQALELWSMVLSRPEPNLAVLNFGKRDVSYDLGLPLALGRSLEVLTLNDQHARVRVPPDDPLRVGDIVRFAIRHPCTALDNWRLLPLVDDGDLLTGALLTFF